MFIYMYIHMFIYMYKNYELNVGGVYLNTFS